MALARSFSPLTTNDDDDDDDDDDDVGDDCGLALVW